MVLGELVPSFSKIALPFSLCNQSSWTDWPLLGTLNSHWDSSIFLPLCPSIVFIYQNSLHPSHLNYTFIPPNYFCTHLNSVQLSWTHRQYISLTYLHKPLLGCVKPKNDHRLSCVLVSTKDVSLCRMYWLDKSVRVVAIMLLLWFGYHSMLLQSTLSGIFTPSVFGWCFQTRRALHCFILRSDLLKTWDFVQFMSVYNYSKPCCS